MKRKVRSTLAHIPPAFTNRALESMIYESPDSGARLAFQEGMSICFLLLAAQVLVAVVAMLRESGKDERFEGEKLGYRS